MMSRKCRKRAGSGKSAQLLEALRRRLARGLSISDETLFFAESTYGISPDGLESALADENFEDREVLLGLICFPDRQSRAAVEQIVEGRAITPEQESAIGAALIGQTGEIRFHTADRQITFGVDLPDSVLSTLVAKLYLARQLDEAICRCLEEQLDRETSIEAKIILRCRGDRIAPDAREILCRLVSGGAGTTGFIEIFQTGLEILGGRAENMSCEQCFLEKKRELLESLKTIREFTRKQDQYGFEYLLMQRYPVPTDSEELVLERLRVVSKITDELLRLGPASGPHLLERSLGDFTPQDLDNLFRTLS
jgi:hypothetical protein